MKRVLGGYALFALALAGVWGIDAWVIPHTDRYIADMLLRVACTVISVIGLALVVGFTGQFSLGHAGFMAVGAYGSATLAMSHGFPFPVAVFAGGLLAAVAGLLVGVPSLRLTGDYLAVVTLGFSQIINVAVLNLPMLGRAQGLIWSPLDINFGWRPGEAGAWGELVYWWVPLKSNFGWCFTWLLLGLVFLRNVLRSRHGRTFAAVRDNEIATRSLGINTTQVKVAAFVIGAFLAGVSGALLAFNMGSVYPGQFETKASIELLAMVVLGGIGSLSGPVLSASVLMLLPEVLRGFAAYRMMLYALLLIGMMILRPKGLLGGRELSDVIVAAYRKLRPATPRIP